MIGPKYIVVTVALVMMTAGCTAALESYESEDSSNNQPNDDESNGVDEGIQTEDSPIELTASLQCASLSWCTNYRGRGEYVPMPDATGGDIANGIYMATSGSLSLETFVFEDGKYSQIWTYLVNAYGSYETDNGKLITTMENSCSHNGTFSISSPEVTEYTYATNGDDLYLKLPCYGPNCSESAKHYRRISSICDNTDNYECPSGNCVCFEFVEQDIPERSDDAGSCNFL